MKGLAKVRKELEELRDKSEYGFDDLVRLLEALRAPDGCPWDREQDHVSLKQCLIEETYEVLEAIDKADAAMMCEELGDVLLQVVFHANIAEGFDIGDVINVLCKKMITRHPHVFGSAVAETPEAVLTKWDEIKRGEKGQTEAASALKSVPANLPALMRAYKVQQKVRNDGFMFDWDDIGQVLDKAGEELGELREAVAAGDQDAIDEEFGDFLFTAVSVARFAKVHPELALTAATEKFIRRFERMERLITADGKKLAGMGLADLDPYWDKVKAAERGPD